jgi:hypothetical protein
MQPGSSEKGGDVGVKREGEGGVIRTYQRGACGDAPKASSGLF